MVVWNKLKVSRLTLLRLICSRIGISKRSKPESLYFSKNELLRLSSYIELVQKRLAEIEKQEKEKKQAKK